MTYNIKKMQTLFFNKFLPMYPYLKRFWITVLLIPLIFLATPSIADETIKIGFVGGLTGKLSDLGTEGRNGVILAIEEKNAMGGLLGKRIELLVRDDKQDPNEALRVDKELIDQGVIAIIGHMTSAMSIAAKPLIDSNKVLMISPTTSSPSLSGQRDFFFRVYETIEGGAGHLSEYIIKKRGLRTLKGVYDLSNRTYTEDFYNYFKSHYQGMGGRMLAPETFVSTEKQKFSSIVKKIRRENPDGLFILASASDTAMICQQIFRLGWKVPLIFSGWNMTEELIKLGGKSVEGALSIITYDPDNQNPLFLGFLKRFSERFGDKPGFPALCSYEAALVLFKAYEKAKGRVEKLPETIISIKSFEGLQGEIQIDEYGDAHRPKFIVTIQNGIFKVIQ